jgi:hypothetical protein
VVGAFPQFVFRLVASAALLAADKHGGTACLRGRQAGMIFHHGQRDGDNNEGSGGTPYDFPFVHSMTNPKFEYRNSKQILNSKQEIKKP